MKDKSNFNSGFMIMTLIAMFFFSVGIIVPSCFSASEKDKFFENFDKDKDGKVSKEEFPGGERAFNKFDKNQDGYIDESEAPEGSPQKGGGGGDFFQNFDKDNDGKVSKEEFPGGERAFNNLDKNKDGFIDESEAPKGPPPRSLKKKVE